MALQAMMSEVLSGIMNLIDKDKFFPDCGGDFQEEDCKPCNYYNNCAQGMADVRQAKDCRLLIEDIAKSERRPKITKT